MKALITGVDGQDGSYLAPLLLSKGYEVHGLVRRFVGHRSNEIDSRVVLHYGDLESYASIFKVVSEVMPNECYHLGAQSFVALSFEDEFTTLNTNINGTHYLLSSIKALVPKCRFYFAASSEMFGMVKETPQNEDTPFRPRSPYGISKVAGYELTRNYRERGLLASSGILFNHESPRRGLEFVTRKITRGAVHIKAGLQSELRLGNLDAQRDWGYAPEDVEAMWKMLQVEPAAMQDYVIATGEVHTIREFCQLAFARVGLDWQKYVIVDREFYRPTDVNILMGDYSKAFKELNWEPKVKFNELVQIMVDAEWKHLAV